MEKTVSVIPAKPSAVIKGLPKETKKRVCASVGLVQIPMSSFQVMKLRLLIMRIILKKT